MYLYTRIGRRWYIGIGGEYRWISGLVHASEGSYLKAPVRGMPEVVLCFLVHEHVHTVTCVCVRARTEPLKPWTLKQKQSKYCSMMISAFGSNYLALYFNDRKICLFSHFFISFSKKIFFVCMRQTLNIAISLLLALVHWNYRHIPLCLSSS